MNLNNTFHYLLLRRNDKTKSYAGLVLIKDGMILNIYDDPSEVTLEEYKVESNLESARMSARIHCFGNLGKPGQPHPVNLVELNSTLLSDELTSYLNLHNLVV